MALAQADELLERKKRTKWLLAGGAVSLLIPLAGAIYLHLSENGGAPGPSGRGDLFERRDGADLKLTPTQTAVVPVSGLTAPPPSGIVAGAAAASGGSSLDFIKSNDDLKARIEGSKAPGAGAPAAPAASTAPAIAAVPPPAAAPSKKAAAKGPKPFSMPKLQPTRGFTNFSGGAKGGAGGPTPGAGGGPSGQNMLNNLPPGAQNNPAVQQYLQSHGGGQQ
jgi:hypothetical protein